MVRRPRRRVAGWSRASYCFDHRPCDQEYRHSKDLNGAGSDLSKPFHGSLAPADLSKWLKITPAVAADLVMPEKREQQNDR